MTAQEAYILAKAYTKKSIEGAGSLKGAACQIKSIEAITGGHRITFEWEDNDGEVSTDTMDVMDGADGNDGVGISSITYKETDAHGNYVYTVTLTDTNTYDIICPKGAQGETGATGATGNGIASIEKTSTAGLVDTYTITYTNGQTTSFTVTNGESITVDSAMSGSSTNPVQNKVITEALADKQDAEDNNLTTEAKTIVGAINEHESDISSLKSGLTNVESKIDDATVYPYADVITIEDAVPSNLADCSVKIEPVQDLHGQSAPYVGGAGKNKLPMTVAGIKAANIAGTWSGNAYTVNGVTFTVNTDNDGNVTEIKATGTANSGADFSLFTSANFDASSWNGMKLNGITGGTSGTYMLRISDVTTGSFTAINGDNTISSLSNTGKVNFIISISSGYSCPSSGLSFYPMIRLSTETDATFAPYTNVCPISGHTEVDVQRDGVNQWNGDVFKSGKAIDNTGAEISANNYSLFKYVLPVGNYTVSFSDTDKTSEVKIARVGVFNSDDSVANVVSTNTYTSESGRLSLSFSVTDKTQYAIVSLRAVSVVDVQLELGQTATPYVPYAGKTYTIALGDTIYGGTVDFDSGVMTVTHRYAEFDGSVDEGWTVVDNGRRLRTNVLVSLVKRPPDASTKVGAISNMFNELTANGTYSGNCGFSFDNDGWLAVADGTNSMTKEDFDSFLSSNHLYICYPLATPTTIQLTPQQIQLLQGQNTLTASTGQISVTANGVSGSIGAVQEQVNATDAALAELAADIAEQLPTAPTTDGAYVLTVTVADGTPTYSWESAT